jgi:hypothetical protein
VRPRREQIESGTKREAHPETANEHAGLLEYAQALTGERGESVFRGMPTAGHKDRATGEDDVFRVATY